MSRTLAAAFLMALVLHPAFAQDSPSPDSVEEDWELTVSVPAPGVTCPQVSMAMTADIGPSSTVMAFNLNYRDDREFRSGGLQVKAYNDDQVLATASQGTAQLETPNETVTWTQRLSLKGGQFQFKVTSGGSTTWGAFGSEAAPLAVSVPTSCTSLAGYRPDASVEQSGPGFGSNRVASMTLLRVRYYQGETLLTTDATPRPISLSR